MTVDTSRREDAITPLETSYGRPARNVPAAGLSGTGSANLSDVPAVDAIGDLADGIAQDLNNVVTIVRGYTGLMLAGEAVSDEMSDSLREVSRAADRAHELVRQLMLLAPTPVVQPVAFDINPLAQEWAQRWSRLFGSGGAVTVRLEPSLPIIEADVDLVEQSLFDLVAFLRKVSGGEREIEVSTHSARLESSDPRQFHLRGRPGLCVEVRATSPDQALDSRALDALFFPYFTTKRLFRETGVGLATVYAVMRQHGGWLKAERGPEGGNAIRLFYPALDRCH